MDAEVIEKVCKAITQSIDILSESSEYKPIGDVIGIAGEALCGKAAEILSGESQHQDDSVLKPCWKQNPPECPV